MKKILFILFIFLVVSSLMLFESCGTDSPKPKGNWTGEEKQSYDQVINIQDEIGDNLDDWFQTMDSLDAIEEAYQAFINSENVSSATINSQGIAVQYANGIRGGLFLNPKDDIGEVGEKTFLESRQDNPGNGLKSLVNQRKMILINPHYFERSYYTDQVKSIDERNLAKVGMELSTFYKNEEATVDRFTELSGYGIIHIYSHGWAWPKQQNITDVYLLTGETANETTSAKYWNELKTGNIPVMKVAGPNKYLVSPEFISEHNDFSKDTVLFYGGFCYSFLGNWPDIIDGFADGAYTGYDWSVYTHKNANWCVNSLFNLSDTTADQPITLNDWFNDTEVPKSYWNARDSRTVHIHYAGDGALKLWDDIQVRLIPLSPDGKPVSEPGEAGEEYPFRCEVVTSVSDLEFIWDIGDGSSPVSASNEVNITWAEDGTYELKVEVRDKSNGVVIGTAMVQVQIGDADLLDFILSCTTIQHHIGQLEALQFSPPLNVPIPPSGYHGRNTDMEWNGLNFSAISELELEKININGTLSNDGQRINAIVERTETRISIDFESKITWTITNLPFDYYEPDGIEHAWDRPGVVYQTSPSNIKDHLSVSGYITYDGTTYTVTGLNWGLVDQCMITIFTWDK